MPPDTIERSPLTLRDPSLLRQQCYVDGHWTNADDEDSVGGMLRFQRSF